MPKLSDTMEEGTLVRWLKEEGDTVEIGEVIAEVETDKATMEMEAFDEGTLARIDVQEGSKVSVGEEIGFIQGEGEDLPEAGASQDSSDSQKEDKKEEAQEQAPSAESSQKEEDEAKPAPSEDTGEEQGGKIKASPLARKMATDNGLDLRQIQGSGPGGRIIKRDIQEAMESGTGKAAAAPEQEKPAKKEQKAAAPAPASKTAPVEAGAEDTTLTLSSMRKVIADRLVESKTTIPHFYLHAQARVDELLKFRKELNARGEEANGTKFTINDFVLKAVVVAAGRVPEVNASFTDEGITQYGSIQLSIAVDIGDGLITPVIRNAQTRTLSDISKQVKDLAARAREKKLKPEEYQGGTITVSNLGGYGVQYFDGIINPPQSLIVSVGAAIKTPVVNENEEIVVGTMMDVGVSCDHRVVDGAIGARFLKELKTLLETPYLILV
jgi:pyruvate dehydrogenase E2 component (dihydrolipoamide acetyltransferase)